MPTSPNKGNPFFINFLYSSSFNLSLYYNFFKNMTNSTPHPPILRYALKYQLKKKCYLDMAFNSISDSNKKVGQGAFYLRTGNKIYKFTLK